METQASFLRDEFSRAADRHLEVRHVTAWPAHGWESVRTDRLADFYQLRLIRPPDSGASDSETDALVALLWATMDPIHEWGTGEDVYQAVWVHAAAHIPGPNQRPLFYEQRVPRPEVREAAGAFYVLQGIPRDEEMFGTTSHKTELAIADFGALARSAVNMLLPDLVVPSATDQDWTGAWLGEVYRILGLAETRFSNHLGEHWVSQRLPFDVFRSSALAIEHLRPPETPALLSLDEIAVRLGRRKGGLKEGPIRDRLGPPDQRGSGRQPHRWSVRNAALQALFSEHGVST